ncbi:putative thioredoxin-related transmembrane protein 1 [Apostichopus japonicus]|uniref:Putative thioredoxin-related transmembrane protein 1 n=1 Tax=Stichopus japonicus TaxID=307972 RepID=A0A2G8L3B7_STIJA|nr:putative thioredoxin-related transmembrane protein 1 [Apostichopus japonicus]
MFDLFHFASYAPWCPACKSIAPIWEKVADWSEDLNIKVGEVDVSEHAGLSGRFFVTALPTIYHVKDGDFRRYLGSRVEDDIISFIEEGKYEEVEKVSWWKHPNSIQMNMLASIFRISMQVRVLHIKMTEEWGFPYWLSYIVFGIATIAAGLLLGLVFVVIADSICPPKPPPRQPIPEGFQQPMPDTKRDEDAQDEGEVADEVIKGETMKDEDSSDVRQRKVADKVKEGEDGEKDEEGKGEAQEE